MGMYIVTYSLLKGNPEDPHVLEYMLSYDPYVNVRRASYPSLLITGSYLDSRVPYWHPTKWIAKLRVHNTSSDSVLLLKVEKDTGHFGDSGRYSHLYELAFQFAFLIKSLS